MATIARIPEPVPAALPQLLTDLEMLYTDLRSRPERSTQETRTAALAASDTSSLYRRASPAWLLRTPATATADKASSPPSRRL